MFRGVLIFMIVVSQCLARSVTTCDCHDAAALAGYQDTLARCEHEYNVDIPLASAIADLSSTGSPFDSSLTIQYGGSRLVSHVNDLADEAGGLETDDEDPLGCPHSPLARDLAFSRSRGSSQSAWAARIAQWTTPSPPTLTALDFCERIHLERPPHATLTALIIRSTVVIRC